MVRIIFGNYTEQSIDVSSDWSILDVGCGSGNNLLPFIDYGCDCFGVEPAKGAVEFANDILAQRGFDANIQLGENRNLPFSDNRFDLLISNNVLPHEETAENIERALEEYARVLKTDGIAFIETVGTKDKAYQNSKVIGPHRFRRQDMDWRDGWELFFFSNTKYLKHYLDRHFDDVETGELRSELMTVDHHYLYGVCRGT